MHSTQPMQFYHNAIYINKTLSCMTALSYIYMHSMCTCTFCVDSMTVLSLYPPLFLLLPPFFFLYLFFFLLPYYNHNWLIYLSQPRCSINLWHCKIPIISPGLIFVQKAVLLGLFLGEIIFGGTYYWK